MLIRSAVQKISNGVKALVFREEKLKMCCNLLPLFKIKVL